MSQNNLNFERVKSFLQKPQNLFLALGLTFGILLCFVTPPLQVPDEFDHFARAYQLAQGQLFSTHNRELGIGLDTVGGELPTSMIEFEQTYAQYQNEDAAPVTLGQLKQSLSTPLNKENHTFSPITAFNYSPVPYAGSIVSSFIGQQLNMSPLLMLYLGRILCLLIAVTLIYFAIKQTPILKSVFVILALMPMVLFQISSVSADSFGIGIAFLSVAIIFKYAFSKDVAHIGKKQVAILVLLFACMALWKQAYAPFALLYFLIPMQKIGSKQKYFGLGILVMLLSLLPMLLWSAANSAIITAATTPINQFNSILSSPLAFAKMLFLTYYSESGMGYFLQTIGVLGWLNVPISFLFHTLPYFIVLSLVVLYENKKAVFNRINRIVMFLVCAGVIGLISLSLYLIWTPVGNTIIDGIQGRYFLPIIPLAIGIISTRRLSLNIHVSRPRLLLALFLIFSCSLVCIRLVTFYYF